MNTIKEHEAEWSFKTNKNNNNLKVFIYSYYCLIYSVNIAPFNIKTIKSALHEFKNMYKNTVTIMNCKKCL